MTNVNVKELIKTCDAVERRCTKICGGMHRGSYLFDKLMRFFSSEPAAVSVTVPVYINCVGNGEATIGRNGSLVMRKKEDGNV